MEDTKVVASVEVTHELVEHFKKVDIMFLAKDMARDMSLRYQVEEMDKAVDLVERLAAKLYESYDRLSDGATVVDQQPSAVLPDVDSLTLAECGELKTNLSRAISAIDQRLSPPKPK